MTLTKDQKSAQVAEFVERFKTCQSVMFSHYIGLNVGNISVLRKQLKEKGAEMKVGKKTLMAIAAKEAGFPVVEADDLEGPVACIFSFSDPLSGAQIAFKFGKSHDQVKLIGGVYEGKILTKEQVVEMAMMPGREQLLAMFMSLLRAPLNQFVGICASPLGGFARALNQMADKGGFVKEAAKAAATDSFSHSETSAQESAPSSDSSVSSISSVPPAEPSPQA